MICRHDERRADDPARALGSHAAAMRRVGMSTRRRAMPRQQPPLLVVNEFRKWMAEALGRLREETRPALDLARRLAAERGDGHRRDGKAQQIREALDAAEARFRDWMSDARIRGMVEKFGLRGTEWQRAQLQLQLRSRLGIDALMLDKKVAGRVADFVEENLANITDLTRSVRAGLERILLNGLSRGRSYEEIAADIERRFEVGESRAAFLARDQIDRLVGQVNMDRQVELGITQFRWRTRRDPRVRPEHRSREGRTYSWESGGPDGEIPGGPWNCRCYAEPVMDGVLTHYAQSLALTGQARRRR